MGRGAGGGRPRKKPEFCTVPDCLREAHAWHLCRMHHARMKRNGDLELRVAKKGTGSIDSQGYRWIFVNGKHVQEHTYLAEKALGRKLPKGACVHHVNGRRGDNSYGNLVLCPNNGYHFLLHKRAREIAASTRLDR